MGEIPEEAARAATEALLGPRVYLNDVNDDARTAAVIATEAAYPAIREQVLADATARIEGLKGPLIDRIKGGNCDPQVAGIQLAGIDAALATLTQPQTEGHSPYVTEDGDRYYVPDITPPGPDADLVAVELTREEAENLEMSVTNGLTHRPSNPPDRRDLYCPTCRAQVKLREALETPGPYAKAFRERVCPVPEFPGIKRGDATTNASRITVEQSDGAWCVSSPDGLFAGGDTFNEAWENARVALAADSTGIGKKES